jgi:hypothetical protein
MHHYYVTQMLRATITFGPNITVHVTLIGPNRSCSYNCISTDAAKLVDYDHVA